MSLAKNKGFSLIELLITLALISLILSLFLLNLSSFGIESTKMIKTMQAQDAAVSALMLLKHQVESANTSECASPTLPAYLILNRDDPEVTRWDNNPREMLGNDALLVYHLMNTQYFNDSFTMPTDYIKDPSRLIVIDDCMHSKVVAESELTASLAEFKPPFSISLLDTRIYFLAQKNGQTALFRYTTRRDEIIPLIDQLEFTEEAGHLNIAVRGEGLAEVYHVQI